MLLFMSPSYLRSDWCKQEINQFLEVNLAENNHEKVFIVAVEPTNRDNWHQRLQQLTSLEFYRKSDSGATFRFGYPKPPVDNADDPYWKNLTELAHKLTYHLKKTSPTNPLISTSAALVSGETQIKLIQDNTRGDRADITPTVWIAQPAEDLSERRDDLARAIRQQNPDIDIRPRLPYPLSTATEFESAVKDDLRHSWLLVQLLNTSPGSPIVGSTTDTAYIQALWAKAHCEINPNIAFLQWRSSDIRLDTASDPKCRELLQGTNASSFIEFSRLILDELDRLCHPVPPPPPPAVAETGAYLNICITAGPKDQALRDDIAGIIEKLGHATITAAPQPESGQTPQEYRAEFEDLLGYVDGVILAHSIQSSLWLQSMFSQLNRFFALRRQIPWGAFVDGPPLEKTSVQFSSPGLMQLDCKTA